MNKNLFVLIVVFFISSCGTEEGSYEKWNLSFTNGITTSNYSFEIPRGFTELDTNNCLICCGGQIEYWDEFNSQISALTKCTGDNNPETRMTGLIINNTIEGTWENNWQNGTVNSGVFTGTRQ